MMMYIVMAISLVVGIVGLLLLYKKIMNDLQDHREEWKREKKRWEQLKKMNKVIT